MSTQSSEIDWAYTCSNCRRGFDATMAHQIIVEENEAELMCPWCKRTDTYQPPDAEEIERPPAIVSHTVQVDEKGHTIARLFFEGGAWLQYREADDRWVYEEMFNTDGERIESFKTEFELNDCEPATAYLHQTMERYERYTVRGLRIQRPHIAAVLIDGQ